MLGQECGSGMPEGVRVNLLGYAGPLLQLFECTRDWFVVKLCASPPVREAAKDPGLRLFS